jgi:hypothetical protein
VLQDHLLRDSEVRGINCDFFFLIKSINYDFDNTLDNLIVQFWLLTSTILLARILLPVIVKLKEILLNMGKSMNDKFIGAPYLICNLKCTINQDIRQKEKKIITLYS